MDGRRTAHLCILSLTCTDHFSPVQWRERGLQVTVWSCVRSLLVCTTPPHLFRLSRPCPVSCSVIGRLASVGAQFVHVHGNTASVAGAPTPQPLAIHLWEYQSSAAQLPPVVHDHHDSHNLRLGATDPRTTSTQGQQPEHSCRFVDAH